MDPKKYYAYNQTKECFLSGELALVDAGLEPLRVLKILIEGLTPNVKSGLWLTHFRNVPVARTLSPFDLVYLDSEFRVVHSVELSTDGEFAPFQGHPASALILPSQSIASSKTRTGDQLLIRATEDTADQPARDLRPASNPQPSASPPDRGATSNPRELSFHVPADDSTVSPLEQFLAKQSSIAAAQSRVQQSAKSLLELSPAAHPEAPKIVSHAAPSVAEPQKSARPWVRVIPSPVPRTTEAEPPRQSRNLPSPAASTRGAQSIEGMAAPAQPIPGRDAQPSRAKVEPFPVRGVAQRAPSVPLDSAEPKQECSAVEEELEPPTREKTSLLMRILRLQFLGRARKAGQETAIPRPKGLEDLKPRSPGVPARVVGLLRWLYPEFEISTEPQTAIHQSYTSRTQFQPEVKPTLDMQFFRWLYPEISFRHPFRDSVPSDRRQSGRIKKPGLVAYYFTGGPPRAHRLSDISVTGFYMHTEERWMPGTIIRMTLQLVDTKGEDPTDTITVHSRVVRWGPDGEGFEFVLAGFLDEPLPISYRKT